MIDTPIVPDDTTDIPRFLREYLGQIAGVFQALGTGQLYPHIKGGTKTEYWDDIISSFTAGAVAGANVPTLSAMLGGVKYYLFSASTMNEVFMPPIHIPHTYKPGTAVFPHIHWCSSGTNTGTVRWGVEYTLAKGHQQGSTSIFPATTTVYLEQAAKGTAYEHMITEVSSANAIPATLIEPDSLILTRVFRDAAHANDTCTDAVFGLMADIHFQKSFWATRNKAPNFYK